MKTPITPDEPASLTAWRPHLFAWALSCVLLVFPFRRGQAENRAEYRYEDYR